MKQLLFPSFLVCIIATLLGCDKTVNYPGGQVSPYISIYDVRDVYKGADMTLSKEVLYGSSKITGVVISDHSAGNLPAGLLVLQDRRRLNELRGIALSIGTEATKYLPGDSIVVDIAGGILKRVDGILQITGLNVSSINKISSGNTIPANRVPLTSSCQIRISMRQLWW